MDIRSRQMKVLCSVPLCNSNKKSSRRNVSLHLFPHNKKRKNVWARALNISKEVTPFMAVCSLHFSEDDYITEGCPAKRRVLKGCAIPSKNIPVFPASKKRGQRNSLSIDLLLKATENDLKQLYQRSHEEVTAAAAVLLLGNHVPSVFQKLQSTVHTQTNLDHFTSPTLSETTLCSVTSQTQETDQPMDLISSTCTKEGHSDKSVQASESTNPKLNVCNLIVNDDQLTSFTGCSGSLINRLVDVIDVGSGEGSDYIESILPAKDKIILTMMRLKLELPFVAIGVLFNVSPSDAKTIFESTANNLTSCIQKIRVGGLSNVLSPTYDIAAFIQLLSVYANEELM